MSLQRKTLLVVGMTLLGLLTLLYIASRSILLDSFTSLEENEVQENLERVLNAINSDLISLGVTGQDWAYWDETYQYALGNNPDYVEANLYDSVFIGYQMNVVLFLNRDLQVLFGSGYNLTTEEAIPVPDSLWLHIDSDNVLMSGLHISDADFPPATSGILVLREGALLFVSLPILPTNGQGSSEGVMIWGRFLDTTAVERLANLVRLPLSIYATNDPAIPPDVLSIRPQLRSGASNAVRPVDGEKIAGYTLINDVEGYPAAIARIEMPRSIYHSGEATISYHLASLIVVGIVFGGVILLLLERMVLARLARLNTSVNAIAASGKLDKRVDIDGNDELARLGTHINEMLAALQNSQNELQRMNQTLEKRVTERTTQLSQTNQQLRQEIVERERAQNELASARDQALESLRLKTQILANVSHDARTPLNAITGYTEMLQEQVYGPINEQQDGVLKRIMGSAQNLLVFINNLLDSAKFEAGTVQPQYRKFHLNEMLESVENTVCLRALDKSLQFSLEIDPSLPEHIYSDEQRIKQILTNLVVNAIKFTERGGVAVRAFRHDDAHWGLEVRDTGRGIEPDVRVRIFEAFWQVDGTPTRRNNSGVGLGLAIVHALVWMLKGEIRVESEVGQGSTFTVILPLLLEQSEGAA